MDAEQTLRLRGMALAESRCTSGAARISCRLSTTSVRCTCAASSARMPAAGRPTAGFSYSRNSIPDPSGGAACKPVMRTTAPATPSSRSCVSPSFVPAIRGDHRGLRLRRRHVFELGGNLSARSQRTSRHDASYALFRLLGRTCRRTAPRAGLDPSRACAARLDRPARRIDDRGVSRERQLRADWATSGNHRKMTPHTQQGCTVERLRD